MGSVAGAIYDEQARQSCSLAGITLMKGKITRLQQLQRSIEANWREAEQARSSAELNNAILLSLKLVKASCDAFIGIAGSMAGPKGEVIDKIYGAADPFATIAGKMIAGDKVNGSEWAKAANTGVSSALGAKFDKFSDVIDLQKVKTDLVVDAIAQDEKSLLEDMQNYGTKVAEMTAKHADSVRESAARAAGKTVAKAAWGRFVAVGKNLITAGQKFATAYEEWKQDDMNATLEGIKRQAKAHHLRVQQQIDALTQAIGDCELSLAKA